MLGCTQGTPNDGGNTQKGLPGSCILPTYQQKMATTAPP